MQKWLSFFRALVAQYFISAVAHFFIDVRTLNINIGKQFYKYRDRKMIKTICKIIKKNDKIFLNFVCRPIAFLKKIYYNKIQKSIQKFPSAAIPVIYGVSQIERFEKVVGTFIRWV